MSDIGKYIVNEQAAATDPEGRTFDLPPWSEAEAERLARGEHLDLTPSHWEVVRYLRDRYIEHGPAASGRHLARELEERFAGHGGRRHLYQLFPNGPVAQGSRIAGVPEPPYTSDRSFGSVE